MLHAVTVPLTLHFLVGHIRFNRSRGALVEVLSSSGEGLAEFLQKEQVANYVIEMQRRITPFQDLLALGRIAILISRRRYNVVHAHTPKAGLLTMLAAWMMRVPVRIYHIHGLPFTAKVGWRRLILKSSERMSVALATRVLCVSRSIREVAITSGVCPDAKIEVIGGGSIAGIPLERFNPDLYPADSRRAKRRELDIPESAVVVGFVGRLVRDKGIADLMDAWESLREKLPNLYCLFVGPFEHEDPLPSSVRSKMLADDRVRCTGLRWDTPALYCAMDILVLPSYREGFPVAPLEGAAMQLPVVATRIPGCVDAVLDNVTGILVPPASVPDLENAIYRYASSPELRREHGAAGRSRIVREFDETRLVSAMYRTYQRLLMAGDR
jgi:glycosyltransferase involved in cell wall biosynthesis